MKSIAKTEPAPIANWTPQQVETIKRTVAPDCSDDELHLFLEVCKATGLNPFTRQIYALRVSGRLQVLTGIDGYRQIAHASGMLHNISAPEYHADRNGKLERARVVVRRYDDRGCLAEYSADAYWAEYGSNKGSWSRLPRLMLGKCAEALCLRRAFPQLSGIYTQEEFDKDAFAQKPIPAPIPVAPVNRAEEITPDKMSALRFAWKDAQERGWTAEEVAIIKLEITGNADASGADLTDDQIARICDRLSAEPPSINKTEDD